MSKIVTFYSFKGGVGRSFILANVAALLAMRGRKVLCIDWDLEAPGLNKYFSAFKKKERPLPPTPGLVELCDEACRNQNADWRTGLYAVTPPRLPAEGLLHFIPAGKWGDDDTDYGSGYSEQLGKMDWKKMYLEAGLGKVLDRWRHEWRDTYDVTFIDSRTGLADTAGICTIHLPDEIVLVMTANEQNLEGGVKTLRRVMEKRKSFGFCVGQPWVLPVLSRLEQLTEVDLTKKWIAKAEDAIAPFVEEWIPEATTAANFLDKIKVQHIPRWTFGEELAVLYPDERVTDPLHVSYALNLIATLLDGDIVENAELMFAPAVTRFSFPHPPAVFTGREDDLGELRASDPADGVVLTALRGMGGIGKTALALVLAREWKARFPDAQIFLDGMGLSDTAPTPGKLIEQVIHTFHPDAKLPEGVQELKAIYSEVLTGKRVLLLLDNAKDARQATPLIPPPGCGLIVTSRQGFPLGTQRPYKVGSLTKSEARDLLRKYVPEITDAHAAELWSLCGGLPFALNLAGAVMLAEVRDADRPPDVERYLTKLKANRLAAFDNAARDIGVDEDIITVTETLRLSEAPLTIEQRNAWRALSVFPAPFDERAACAVAGADEGTLQVLLHRSLVEKEKGRLRLNDLVAEYAQREMGAEALEEIWRNYVAHYTAVGNEANAAYLAGGENMLVGLRLFDLERAHVEAAFAWLKDRTDRPSAEALLALVLAVAHTSDLRFHPRQRIQWLEAQLRSARATGHRDAESSALGNLGITHAAIGDTRKAIAYFNQVLTICRETGDRHGEGMTLNNLGIAYAALGDARKAIKYYEQRLVIAREMGDRRGEGAALNNIGSAHYDLGDARKVIENYEQSLVIKRETGDRRGEGQTLGNLGVAHASLGDARKAIEYYAQQLTITRETGDRRGEGKALWNSAILLAQRGNRQEAIFRAEEALRIYEAIEDPDVVEVRRELEKWKSAGGR